MFTGIIEGVRSVKSVSKTGHKSPERRADMRLSIDLGNLGRGLRVGSSVCINGACLSITKIYRLIAEFELVQETVDRTCLGLLRPGDRVNVERSLRLGDRLEGHIVLGHVDTIGIIDEIAKSPKQITLWIKIKNHHLFGSIISKGSIAIDGISLTVVDVRQDKISIALIPHTVARTTLALKLKDDKVNIEMDIVGKYIVNNLTKFK
jgi:riboflavin synthase